MLSDHQTKVAMGCIVALLLFLVPCFLVKKHNKIVNLLLVLTIIGLFVFDMKVLGVLGGLVLVLWNMQVNASCAKGLDQFIQSVPTSSPLSTPKITQQHIRDSKDSKDSDDDSKDSDDDDDASSQQQNKEDFDVIGYYPSPYASARFAMI